MNHEVTVCLAQTSHGRVTLCACGCTSLTFSRVTLHFDSEAEFETMARTVLEEERERAPDEEFDLRYDWFSVSLSPQGSAELAGLVRDAIDALQWARGDMEFTEDDLRQLRLTHGT